MASTTTWLIKDKIIYSQFVGVITVAELCEDDKSMLRLLRSTEGQVHHLVDTSLIKAPPIDIAGIIRCRQYLNEPNLGWSVLYGMSTITSFVAKIVGTNLSKRFRLYVSLEESLKFLQGIDDTLPPLDPASIKNLREF